MRAQSGHDAPSVVGPATAVVVAYVSNNSLPAGEVATLIETVHRAMLGIASGAVKPDDVRGARRAKERPTAADVRKSIRDHGIVSFIDGKSYKTLKRHLTSHGLDPEGYRHRYGLPSDYPMVAPAYAERRSTIAKAIGLGQATPTAAREGMTDRVA